MSRMEQRNEKHGSKIISKIIVVALFLVSALFILKYAYNYLRDDITDKTNVVINNSNVTADLENDAFIENGVTYLSKEDIYNFFDRNIYYDEKYDQIITGSNKKIAAIVVGEKQMTNNGSIVKIKGTVIKKNGTYYIPFSELDDIYNVKTTYIEKSNIVVIDSLDRKFVVADSTKNNNVKYKRTLISRTIDKLEKGDSVIVVNNSSEDRMG